VVEDDMTKWMRHARLALILVVGVAGVVGATLLVAVGAPAPTPNATMGQLSEAMPPRSDDGIQLAQLDTQAGMDGMDGMGKCPSKPCPKVRYPAN
jgi:hypothetical protein